MMGDYEAILDLFIENRDKDLKASGSNRTLFDFFYEPFPSILKTEYIEHWGLSMFN